VGEIGESRQGRLNSTLIDKIPVPFENGFPFIIKPHSANRKRFHLIARDNSAHVAQSRACISSRIAATRFLVGKDKMV